MATDARFLSLSRFSDSGASKTVDWLFPSLKGKVKGTSIRVPINNVSMIDLNITFNEDVDKEAFCQQLQEKMHYPEVIKVHKDKSVSSDFIGSK